MEVLKAFEVLGCSPRTPWVDVEKAYRRKVQLAPLKVAHRSGPIEGVRVDAAFGQLQRYYAARAFDIEHQEPASLLPPSEGMHRECLWCPHREGRHNKPASNLMLISLVINALLLMVGLTLLLF